MPGAYRRSRTAALAAATACLVIAWGTKLGAQVPDEFTNLQVLPKDISKADLMQSMKGFAMGLGVRCTHCHVGEEGQPLSTFDFASDAKKPKKDARAMMRMVREINETLLAQIDPDPAQRVAVSCVTCHHGQLEPRTIESVLDARLATGGIDSAVATYRGLREKHYGGFAYDFSEGALNAYASQLAAQKKAPEALRMLHLNAEFHPRSASTQFFLGQLYLQAGDVAQARASFEKALEFDPANPGAKRALEKMNSAE